MRDEAATDDILQEVFISLWEKREQFAFYDKISGWLFVASYNRSMNALRKQVTERVYKKSVESNPLSSQATYIFDPSAAELQEQQFLLLEEAIANLPPQRKRVFELCRLQGKTYEQTAAELSISRNTVKEHLQKAAESIRNYILSHPGDPMLVASLALLFFAGDFPAS
jgi:RNA polymerase sigma factor (sigma-70 family)